MRAENRAVEKRPTRSPRWVVRFHLKLQGDIVPLDLKLQDDCQVKLQDHVIQNSRATRGHPGL